MAVVDVCEAKVWYHPMLAYYKLLNRALLRKTGRCSRALQSRRMRSFHSRFRGDTSISEAGAVGNSWVETIKAYMA